HTTQFAIPQVGLFEPVLSLAAEAATERDEPPILVAGAIGRTEQAVREARIARGLGYHAVLLSLAAWKGASEDEIIAHCQAVAAEMPVFGFYLQPAVGGVPLKLSFWRRFAAIENVIAIKMAPFDRYATLDVLRGVLEAGAQDRIALYTGNDDHIVADLLTPFALAGAEKPLRILGVIAGCHEILRRQGLLDGIWCLDPDEGLSPGQSELLTAVAQRYPHLTDDAFVRANLNTWLS
ncbi:MAG: dihydrodipicolinate synthase family protein, partial [Rhodospirillales bacterium 12-71-4]